MKKYTLLTVLLFGLLIQKSNAQSTTALNTQTGANYLGYDALSSGALNFATAYPGTGAYQMTLTTGGNLNIIGAAKGYEIGGDMFLWSNGSTYNAYMGVSAGASTTAGFGGGNVFCGFQAGKSMTTGSFGVYCGLQAGMKDVTGEYNTFIGYQTGLNTTGMAGGNQAGDYNTFVGDRAGEANTTGQGNSYCGAEAGFQTVLGSGNCAFGDHSLENVGGSIDSNSSFGFYTGYNLATGNSNVMMGVNSGSNCLQGNYNVFIGGFGGNNAPLNPSGNYNVTLGYGADAYTAPLPPHPLVPGPVFNSVAIGADAIVNFSNQVILGNNLQFVGIGESSDNFIGRPGPQWNLEICTEHNPIYSLPGLGGGTAITSNTYGGTGFSGLKFRDLTSNSTPVLQSTFTNTANPYPTGVLSVDGYGNVIYVAQSGSGGIGYCSALTSMASNGGYDLNNNSFYFKGQSSTLGQADVNIGYTCTVTPTAKLNVLQSSGTNSSVGIYVENTDYANSYTSYPAVIGIESQMPAITTCFQVAGWFEADGNSNCTAVSTSEYAIFVPANGGTVDIGYPYSTDFPNPMYLLKVNSLAWVNGVAVGSDSVLKKNVTPFKYGLKAIRNLNPVTYEYNGIGGFDTTGHYIGLIAQNLQRNVPNAVRSSLITKDTINHDTATVLSIYEEGVLYTAVNAIKQLDSTVTSKSTTIDSLRNTLDSLRSAFKSIQSCLTQLCNNGHGASRHNGGSGNSGDSNTSILNMQDITLSALANAPLLYQNIPNPFNTATKINYYLPLGTQGATIAFCDSYGNKIKTVELSQTGNGTLNITPDNLTSGIYSYSLVVNGNVIDTKRMILQK